MKRQWARVCLGFAGVTGAVVLVAFFPGPLEGNWRCGGIDCLCDSHNFFRFEDGKVIFVRGGHPPPEWLGNYEKTGWGTYRVTMRLNAGTVIAKPGVLLLRPFSFLGVAHRDFRLATCDRILAKPEHEWLTDVGSWNLMILVTNGHPHYYYSTVGVERTLPQIEDMLLKLKERGMFETNSLVLYSEGDAVPETLLSSLFRLGIRHERRSLAILRRRR